MKKNLKIACISDFSVYSHTGIKFLSDIDVLLISGSIARSGYINEFNVFVETFLKKLEKIPIKIFTGGPTDKPLEIMNQALAEYLLELRKYGIWYLYDSSMVVQGFNIYGSPFTLEVDAYPMSIAAFKEQTEFDLKKHFDKIPQDTHVLLTAAAPYGIMDYTNPPNLTISKQSIGSESLRYRVEELPNLKAHVFASPDAYGALSQYDVMYANPKIRKNSGGNLNEYNEPIILNIEK